MKKRLIGEAQCLASLAQYYLLEEDAGESYGVEIEMEGETAVVPDISPSRRQVEALADALLRGTVTPVGLRDVVDDWLLV